MPQIAQQDYIVIKPKEGRTAQQDVECLRRLKLACENGTIFDCLVGNPVLAASEDAATLNRVLGAFEDATNIDVADSNNGEYATITLPYTVEQYSGLAAVQNAIDEMDEVMTDFPTLTSEDSRLTEGTNSVSICVDGKYLTPTASDGKLTALAIAETGPDEGDDYINITWEDALKLIGLPIS